MSENQPIPGESIPALPQGQLDSPSIPEEPAPMLDVHPAHHAASTWREFFVHIATIVLGLIIAVGLEQTVEYIHHRRQARETRENIQREIATNLDFLEQNQKLLAETQQQLSKNLDLLNSGAPDAQILPQLGVAWILHRRQDAAWNAAKLDGSLALIPPSQIAHASYFYETNDALGPVLFGYFTDMDTVAALVDHARAAGQLTPSERQLLVSLTASAMGRNLLISRMFTSEIHALQSNELQ
jgi:hypothetical protein